MNGRLLSIAVAAPFNAFPKPLTIYGPFGTKVMVSHLLKAYHLGISEHKAGLAQSNHPAFYFTKMHTSTSELVEIADLYDGDTAMGQDSDIFE